MVEFIYIELIIFKEILNMSCIMINSYYYCLLILMLRKYHGKMLCVQ